MRRLRRVLSVLKRAVTGTGRWVRPGRRAAWTFVGVVAGAVLLGVLVFQRTTRSASPARTLALAASVLPDPPALDSALSVTWRWSVRGTGALEERWLSLVAPGLPPGVCFAPDADVGELGRAVEGLNAAVERDAGRDELERRLLEVRAAGAAAPGSRGEWLVRYALARGYAAGEDWATAADLLEPALEGWVSGERVPEANRSSAGRLLASGRVTPRRAADAVLTRYLAGTVAYHRGEPERAIALFRRAINAVNYLVADRRRDGLAPEGHYQRLVVGVGSGRCRGDRADDALTSLDAYAGLVAAYMADSDFRDPAGLRREVARTRLEIDPGDPFVPVLEHARLTGGDPERTPVPENLLWAASNLQRVYHYNRLRPEPRLEVTRAVLLLHLTGDSTWVSALRNRGGARTCTMLGGIAEDLQRDAAALELGRRPRTATDSARAAVAVQTFARVERDCSGGEAVAVEPPVRSAWIRLGGRYLTLGVGGTYETIRTELVETLRAASASPSVVEDRLAPPLERVRSHRRTLGRGRVPSEMPADVPVEPVERFVDDWWRAVFADVAGDLMERVRSQGDADALGIRAGQVPELLTALESAVAHAGLRPVDVYAAGELTPLAATGGRAAALGWTVRTWVRNHPGVTLMLLLLALAGLASLALVVHVSWWRYRLLTGRRFYVEELKARHRDRRRAA